MESNGKTYLLCSEKVCATPFEFAKVFYLNVTCPQGQFSQGNGRTNADIRTRSDLIRLSRDNRPFDLTASRYPRRVTANRYCIVPPFPFSDSYTGTRRSLGCRFVRASTFRLVSPNKHESFRQRPDVRNSKSTYWLPRQCWRTGQGNGGGSSTRL